MLPVCSVKSICKYLQNDGTSLVYGNLSGCNTALEILAACQVSDLEAFQENNEISLSPNPVQQTLFIGCNVTNPLTFRIFNLMGAKLASGEFQEVGTVDVSALPAGTYFLQIQAETGFYLKQFVKTSH